MEHLHIQRAFEKELKQFDPVTPTAYENQSFSVPDTEYMRVRISPNAVENPTFGDNFFRESGRFIIFLCYPLDKGTSAALTKASGIRDYFKRGKTLVESGTTVQVESTPQIAGGVITDDRYVVPVVIEYFANVLKV
jgi:Bacteriophage related domain of unknown function